MGDISPYLEKINPSKIQHWAAESKSLDAKDKISRRHFEVCVFSYLASELKSGDICVTGSQDYADYREQLLPWSDCLPLLDEYCDNLGWPNNPNDFVEHLKSWLDETAKQVDDGYPNNSQIVISEFGEPVLKRLKKKADNPSLKALESLIEVFSFYSLWYLGSGLYH